MNSIDVKYPPFVLSPATSNSVSAFSSLRNLIGESRTKKTAVKRAIINAIAKGMFKEGDKLPSIIQTAKVLSTSRNTVKGAYLDLVDEHIVVARRRDGHFVARKLPVNLLVEAEPQPHPDVIARSQAHAGNIEFRKVPLNAPKGQISSAGMFPVAAWRKATWLAISRNSIECWAHSFAHMEEILVREIIGTVLPRRGIRAAPSEVLITTGTRSAYYLIADCLFSPETRIGIEDPGNPAFRAIAGRYTKNLLTLPVGMEGIDQSTRWRPGDYLFCAPICQCPTTRRMEEPEREGLLNEAERENVTIIEDDTESELMHIESLSPSLYASASKGRVLYVGAFAESLSEGLRIGYVVGARPVIAQLRARRSLLLQEAPTNNQSALAHFIHEGFYDSHVSSMYLASRHRAHAFQIAFQEVFPDWQLMIHAVGTKGWIRLPSACASRLLEANVNLGVSIHPGDDYFFSKPPTSNFVRVDLGELDQERIHELLLHWKNICHKPRQGGAPFRL